MTEESFMGSCLCGRIRYALTTPGIAMNYCHCTRCQKFSGSAFGTYLHTTPQAFMWLAGEDEVRVFALTLEKRRAFCGRCGSPVPLVKEAEEHVIVPVGSLDEDPGLRPVCHLFASAAAPWHESSDELPRFEEYAPDEFWEPFEAEARERDGT